MTCQGFQSSFINSLCYLPFDFLFPWLNGEDRNASLEEGRLTRWKGSGTLIDRVHRSRSPSWSVMGIEILGVFV